MDRAQRRRMEREFENAKDGVVIGYISGGVVEHEFLDSMMGTMLHDARSGDRRILQPNGGTMSLQSSPRIVSARTMVCTNFLEQTAVEGARWLMMIDTDMDWEDDAIHRMLDRAEADDRKIVGGLCFAGGRSEQMYPTLYRTIGTRDDGLPRNEVIDLADPDLRAAINSDDPPVLKIDSTGAAFLAVEREVLEQMVEYFGFSANGHRNPHPFFAELVGDNVEYGEDVAFCLRARQLGYSVWVDTAIKVGHQKKKSLTWNRYQDEVLDARKPELSLTLK